MTDFDLDQFLPYRLARAAQAVSDEFATLYRARFGLSMPEWRVLVHVSDTGGASVRDIEARVGLEKSKVSRAASRLEKRGLLSKRGSDADRRLIVLALTVEGQALMAELLPLAEQFQKELKSRLGASFGQMSGALDQLLVSKDPT